MLKLVIFAGLLSVGLAQSFKECVSNSVLTVQKIQTAPYPPSLSQGFQAEYSLGLTRELSGNIDVKLEISKKVGFIWIKVPCMNNIGSCTYNDICATMEQQIDEETCGALTQLDLPCRCPLPAKHYEGSQTVPPLDLGAAGAMASGKYKAKGEIFENGQKTGCVEAEVEIKA